MKSNSSLHQRLLCCRVANTDSSFAATDVTFHFSTLKKGTFNKTNSVADATKRT